LAHGADTQIEDNQGQKAIDLTQSQEIKDLLQGDLLAFLSFHHHHHQKLIQSSMKNPTINQSNKQTGHESKKP
jgi:hypothetical protein